MQRRVLWLATSMVHHANRVRTTSSGVKVGGHEASSASMVGIMTALYFEHLRAPDRVSVKPHAAPVLHAINYLLGSLDRSHLTTLREFGGLQSYPSRAKDAGVVDFSTGSVGIGATATLWSAIAQRYVAGHFDVPQGGRHVALVGDAELDEGAIWEALVDPMVARLGEVLWIVDLNRQSLDRVVPDMAAGRLRGMFEAAGWETITVKYGRRLRELFERPGGEALRDAHRLDEQRGVPAAAAQPRRRAARAAARATAPGGARSSGWRASSTTPRSTAAIADLGGHDLADLLDAFRRADEVRDRPAVIFAYTIKARGLPTQGHPANHSALMTARAVGAARRASSAPTPPTRGRRSPPARPRPSSAGRRGRAAARDPRCRSRAAARRPARRGARAHGHGLDAAGLRALLRRPCARATRGRRARRHGLARRRLLDQPGRLDQSRRRLEHGRADRLVRRRPETLVRWRESSHGQHIELGIAEGNLVGLLGELGATWSRAGLPLLPIGALYDPFVNRALEPWSFGIYAGGQSILVGTPSGVTLAPEGGAHQSIITPSVGLEQPRCVAWEPAFGQDLEWTLLAALGSLGHSGGSSAYFRLSTRPIDQALAGVPSDPAAREQRRRQVLAGGYLLREAERAARRRARRHGRRAARRARRRRRARAAGLAVDVVCLTSADLVFRALQARQGLGAATTRSSTRSSRPSGARRS